MESKQHIHSVKNLHVVKGLTVPDFIVEECLDRLKSFPLRGDDVWIVTCLKAGTTWTQQIVRLLRHGFEDKRKICDAIPWLEVIPRLYSYVKVEEMQDPRSFKSHFPYDLMPCGVPHSTSCKYIYVARNPKDLCVSLYYHYRAYKGCLEADWDTHYQNFISGVIYFGDYFDHVLGWWTHKDDENVLFLKYEDMKKNLSSVVRQIAEFIGCSGVTQETIDEIVSRTTFQNMKDDTTANYSWKVPNFLRKGEVGDWKNYFTPEQSQEFDEVYAKRMAGSGLEFEFSLQ